MDSTTFSLILILLLSLLSLLAIRERSFSKEREAWEKERESQQAMTKDLLNRLMTKEWTSYAQVTALANQESFNEEYVGMSDEEELARAQQIAQDLGYSVEYGETLIEMPDPEILSNELRDLGLIDDE